MESVRIAERDCAVCLQKCHYPTQLPCGHIFCFLCVKGVAIQSKKCAMCRADIPPDYLDHPMILEKISPEQRTTDASQEFQWYYEGRNGWWRYDERSNSELEASFNAGDTQCKLLLAGALYCIDFANMMQVQSRDPTRRRRVKRDSPALPAKGIAGIKITNNPNGDQVKTENIRIPDSSDEEGEVIDISDNDSTTDEDDELPSNQNIGVLQLVDSLRSLDLQEQALTEEAAGNFPTNENT